MALGAAAPNTAQPKPAAHTPEGDGVRITAKRFSELKKYTSPLSSLVKRSPTGTWLIYEEVNESQP